MPIFIGSVLSAGGTFALATNFDAWFVYALMAWLIGLIAWSKYTEPALSPAYPAGHSALGAGRNHAAAETVASRSPASARSPAADHEAV